MSSYAEKLKDPRWQKKRLEIFERDGWECVRCGDATTELHVHHKRYDKWKNPWDYNNQDLETLCEFCHKNKHEVDHNGLIEVKFGVSGGGNTIILCPFCNNDCISVVDVKIVTYSRYFNKTKISSNTPRILFECALCNKNWYLGIIESDMIFNVFIASALNDKCFGNLLF